MHVAMKCLTFATAFVALLQLLLLPLLLLFPLGFEASLAAGDKSFLEVQLSLDLAKALGCKTVSILAGAALQTDSQYLETVVGEEQDVYVEFPSAYSLEKLIQIK